MVAKFKKQGAPSHLTETFREGVHMVDVHFDIIELLEFSDKASESV